MQRRKDLWGDDAEEYNPERWINKERVEKMVADPFMFIPFSAGPRICLGQVTSFLLLFGTTQSVY